MHGTSGLGLVLQFILNFGTSLLRKFGEKFAIYRIIDKGYFHSPRN